MLAQSIREHRVVAGVLGPRLDGGAQHLRRVVGSIERVVEVERRFHHEGIGREAFATARDLPPHILRVARAAHEARFRHAQACRDLPGRIRRLRESLLRTAQHHRRFVEAPQQEQDEHAGQLVVLPARSEIQRPLDVGQRLPTATSGQVGAGSHVPRGGLVGIEFERSIRDVDGLRKLRQTHQNRRQQHVGIDRVLCRGSGSPQRLDRQIQLSSLGQHPGVEQVELRIPGVRHFERPEPLERFRVLPPVVQLAYLPEGILTRFGTASAERQQQADQRRCAPAPNLHERAGHGSIRPFSLRIHLLAQRPMRGSRREHSDLSDRGCRERAIPPRCTACTHPVHRVEG
jgi:hypothetical protein